MLPSTPRRRSLPPTLLLIAGSLAITFSTAVGQSADFDVRASERGELVFRSGFEAGVKVVPVAGSTSEIFTGTDSSTGYRWDTFNDYFDRTRLFYLLNDSPREGFVESAVGEGKGVGGSGGLLLEVKGDAPGDNEVTRNEYMLEPRADGTGFFQRQGYARYRMKFDIELLATSWPSHWINFFEVKQGEYPHRNYRFYYTVRKMSESDVPHWGLNIHNIAADTLYQLQNKDVAVPVDRWFTVEAYWRKDAQDGRLCLAIDGQVVFDYRGETEHPTDPLAVGFWSPIKSYRGREWSAGDRRFRVWYDDLELWTGFPGSADEVVLEAEDFVSSEARTDALPWQTSSDQAGYQGTGYVHTANRPPRNNSFTQGGQLRYSFEISRAGVYDVWVRRFASDVGSNSAYFGLDDVPLASVDNGESFGTWHWFRLGHRSLRSGQHSLQLVRREAGYLVDQFRLTYDPTADSSARSVFPYFAEGKKKTTESGLRVFPNPVSSHQSSVRVTADAVLSYVSVHNARGQLVLRADAQHRSSILLNTSLLPQGVYFLKAATPEHLYTKKVLIE